MSATHPIGVDSSPVSTEVAVRQQLDALAKGEIDHATFLDNMKERFRFEPDDNWEVLSLLDQYYRRGKISQEVFRELKNGIAEYILGPQNSAPSPQDRAPTLHTVVRPAASPVAPSSVTTSPVPPSAAAPAAVATAAAPHPIFAGPAPSPLPSQATIVRAPVEPSQPARAPVPQPTVRHTFSGSAPTIAQPTADVYVAPAAAAAVAAGTATTAALPRDAQVGDLLRNRYRLDGLISRGAAGIVFEANDPFRLNLPPSGKRIAVKVLRCPDARGVFINQLRQEFHHLQLLSHPNIVRAFDFDRDGGLAFFTMELLNGEHLNRTLQARGKALERSHALAIIRDVGSAVAYAHSRGIAHGELSPHNVLVTTRGEVRVLGFGASNTLSGTSAAPEFDQAIARSDSYRYASCEVIQGGRPDPSDDLYSLSCLAYWLLAGKHAFADRSCVEARTEGRRPKRPAGLRYGQWKTLRAGLHTDAKKRPSDVASWLDGMELGAAAKHLPPASELIASPGDAPQRMRWAIAAILVVALIGGGYWLYRNQELLGLQTTQPVAQDGAALTPTPADTSLDGATPATRVPSAAAPVSAAPAPAMSPRPTAKTPAPTTLARAPTPAAAVAVVAPSPSAAARAAAPQAPGASKVEMAVDTMDASPTDAVVHVIVRRKGNLRGQTSFTWWTESGTAKPGVDFAPVLPHTQQMQDGEASMVLSVPVLPTVRAQEKGFYVGIEEADGGALIGARSLTQITLPPTN